MDDKPKCKICRFQGNSTPFGHWRWHEFVEGELNPVALIAWIDKGPQTPEVRRIREYIIGVTGIKTREVYAELAKDMEQAQAW